MPLNNSLAAVNAGTKMDLVDAPNALSVAVLQAGLPRAVEKADGAVLAGADALFTVAGGPVLCQLYGMVATAVVGTSTCRLSHLPTAPAVAVELNAAAVAIDNAAIGTLFYNVGATSVFTPVAVGAIILNPVLIEPCWFLLSPGVVRATCSDARVGVVRWFMQYYPLSPLSIVTAAA